MCLAGANFTDVDVARTLGAPSKTECPDPKDKNRDITIAICMELDPESLAQLHLATADERELQITSATIADQAVVRSPSLSSFAIRSVHPSRAGVPLPQFGYISAADQYTRQLRLRLPQVTATTDHPDKLRLLADDNSSSITNVISIAKVLIQL